MKNPEKALAFKVLTYNPVKKAYFGPYSGAYWKTGGKWWMHCQGKLEKCRNGIHACRSEHTIGTWTRYRDNSTLFVVELREVKGTYSHSVSHPEGKVYARSGRIVAKVPVKLTTDDYGWLAHPQEVKDAARRTMKRLSKQPRFKKHKLLVDSL